MKQLGLVILSVLLLLSCGNNGKGKVETSIGSLKKKTMIRAEESFSTTRTNLKGEVLPQWKKSDSLYIHASIQELVQLASKHNNKIERLVAFRALLRKEPHEAVNLAISEIEDTTIVSVSDGMCAEKNVLSNVRIGMIQYKRTKNNVSVVDSIRLDSAVLFSANSAKFYYSKDLFHRLPAKPEYEQRLRQLYKQDCCALIALARFHKKEEKREISRLLSQLEYKDSWSYHDTIRAIMDAVAVWPSPSYKQQVRQVCRNILSKKDAYCYSESTSGALMAYNDRWGYNLIDKMMLKAKQKDSDYYLWLCDLHEAYNNHPYPRFKPLIKKYPLKQSIGR